MKRDTYLTIYAGRITCPATIRHVSSRTPLYDETLVPRVACRQLLSDLYDLDNDSAPPGANDF